MSQNATETELPAHQPAANAPQVKRELAGCKRERRSPFGLPRVYWVLWTGALVNRVGGTVFALLSIYLTRVRGLSPELAGLVLSLYAGGTTVAGPVGGVLADRIGRRATLILATSGAGSLMLVFGFVRAGGTGSLVIIAPLLGLFTDLARPPLLAAITDVVPTPQRGQAFALLYWAINLGFASAAVLGGSLAERSFTPLFVIDALTTFAYGTIVFLAVPETRPPATTTTAVPPERPPRALDLHALLAPFLDRRFMRFLMVQAVLLVAFAQVIVSLPLDMRNHGLSTVQIGWLLGLNGLLIVVAQPIVLRFVRGFSHAQWLVAGAGLTGIGLGVNTLAGGAAIYAVATLIWTLGEIGFSTATPAIIAELAPLDRRGAYHGANQVVWGAAFMAAPLLGPSVLAHAGGGALWLGCLAAGVAAAVLHHRRGGAPGQARSVS